MPGMAAIATNALMNDMSWTAPKTMADVSQMGFDPQRGCDGFQEIGVTRETGSMNDKAGSP
jgi:hypothetical protein